MKSPGSIIDKPVTKILAIIGGAILVYAFLARPVEVVHDFELDDQLIYIANGPSGLRIVNKDTMSEQGSLVCLGRNREPGLQSYNLANCVTSAKALTLHENNLFLANGRRGVWAFDIQNPTQPIFKATTRLPGDAQDIVALDGYLFIAAGRRGLQVIKVTDLPGDSQNPGSTIELKELKNSEIKFNGSLTRIFKVGNRLFAADNRKQLFLIDITNKQKPQIASTTKFEDNIYDLYSVGNLLFLAAGKAGLLVMDATNPAELTEYSKFTTEGNVQSLDLQGPYGYLSDKKYGLITIDISDPKAIRKIGDSPENPGDWGKIRLSGEYAYIARGTDGLIKLKPAITFNFAVEGTSNSPIFAEDLVKAGNYVYLAASERGLRILNVSNPAAPQPAGVNDTDGRAQAIAVSGALAFLADGDKGLAIIDVNNPDGNLPNLGKVSSKQAVDIAVAANIAYLGDKEEGLKVIDVTLPMTPTLTGSLPTINGQAFHIYGLDVVGDYAYTASGDQGFQIINIHDKNLPALVKWLTLPGLQNDAREVSILAVKDCTGQPNTCSSYSPDLNDPATRIYAYLANGVYGLVVYDVTNPVAPFLVNQIAINQTTDGGAVEILADQNRLYLGVRNYGVNVYDISNPIAPLLIGYKSYFQESNQITGLAVDGAYLYTAVGINGLRISNVSNPNQIQDVSLYDPPETIRDLAVSGDSAYTVDGKMGMWINNIANPANPQEVAFVRTPGQASGLFIDPPLAYIADGESGLRVFNVSTPTQPGFVGEFNTDGLANAIQVAPSTDSASPALLAYIADGLNGLVVLDVTQPENIKLIGHLSDIGDAFSLTIWKNYALVLSKPNGLVAVSIVEPSKPAKMSEILAGLETKGIASQGDYAFVAGGAAGLYVVDVSNPIDMKLHRTISSATPVENVSELEPYLFVAVSDGVKIYENVQPGNPWERGFTGDKLSFSQIIDVVGQWNPPIENTKDPGYYRLYAADLTQGFQIVKSTKQRGFQDAGIYVPGGSAGYGSLAAYLISLKDPDRPANQKPARTIQEIVFQVFLVTVGGLFFWMGIMALFILPANQFADWEAIFVRLALYLFGKHGPVIRVREGKAIQYPEEENRLGPGLALVDASSAVVLERRNIWRDNPDAPLDIARVEGAGVVYIGGNAQLLYPRFQEKVKGVADLRPQIRLAFQVKAYTRDEIEVETTLFTIFTLGEPPDVVMVTYVRDDQGEDRPYEAKDLKVISLDHQKPGSKAGSTGSRLRVIADFSDDLDLLDKQEIHDYIGQQRLQMDLEPHADLHTLKEVAESWAVQQQDTYGLPYVLNRERITRAIYASAVDEPEQTDLEWTDLPTQITIEIFRDMLSRWMYDDLYRPLHAEEFRISRLKTQLGRNVRNQGILAYQFVRRKDGQPFKIGDTWREEDILSSQVQLFRRPYPDKPKILRDRGIKVKYAGFAELTPTDESVRDRLFEYWQARLKKEEDFILGDFELLAGRERAKAKVVAQKEIMTKLKTLLDETRGDDTALAIRVLESLESAAADPETRNLVPDDTINMLRNLRNWIIR